MRWLLDNIFASIKSKIVILVVFKIKFPPDKYVPIKFFYPIFKWLCLTDFGKFLIINPLLVSLAMKVPKKVHWPIIKSLLIEMLKISYFMTWKLKKTQSYLRTERTCLSWIPSLVFFARSLSVSSFISSLVGSWISPKIVRRKSLTCSPLKKMVKLKFSHEILKDYLIAWRSNCGNGQMRKGIPMKHMVGNSVWMKCLYRGET